MPNQPLPKAQVKPMHVVKRSSQANGPVLVTPQQTEPEKTLEWITPKKKSFVESLTRNVAVAAALLLFVVAVRNAAVPEAKDVFTAVKDSVNMNLDETLGKLSFVSNLLPESALVFWSNDEAIQVTAPVHGDVVHTFSEEEPYVGLLGVSNDVHAAADGEVMNIAHGDGEERIMRVRHDDGLETIYGNLSQCYVEEGDQVYEGDVIGETADKQPVYFEVRRSGRSVDPVPLMKEVVAEP